ncbi:MAG: two-component sensor histidine kinase [Gammaproteobacteria bacterium]|nr:two-component sensor histidine kinase [Gammaproteobacteria bacterium]
MLSLLSHYIKEKLLPPSERELYAPEVRPWYPVRLLALYRLFVAVLLSSTFFSGLAVKTLGTTHPALFSNCSVVYLVLSLLWLLLLRFKRYGYSEQVYLQITSDVVLLVLMMYASGGLSSGLGILLVVNVGSATLIISGLAGLFFAALATILVLLEQIYTHWQSGFVTNSYQLVGTLGAAYFGVTLVMLVLKRRVQESELLVEQRELDIENLAQLNEQIIQHMQSGVMVIDSMAQIRLINRAAKMQLGISNINPPTALTDVSSELSSRFSLWQTAAQQTPTRIRFPGSPFELQPHFTPLGPDGEAGTLVVLEDTTPYSREFQNIKLTSLGRLTASIAHEIRNPLSAIQHAAQLLSESDSLTTPDQRLTQIISQQTLRVNTIIENILQLSVKEKTEPTQIDLNSWLLEFVDEFKAQHTEAAYELHLNITTSDPLAYFDPTQLHQIVWNLCTNSLKYGKDSQGRIKIVITAGCDRAIDTTYLDIADYGRGVPPSNQDKIFEPFFSSGGNSPGLGLYIVRELCEFNYATIRYIDDPGFGAVFRIQFSNPLIFTHATE